MANANLRCVLWWLLYWWLPYKTTKALSFHCEWKQPYTSEVIFPKQTSREEG